MRAEVERAVARVFETQHFILGSEGEALERRIAELTQVRHAVGCASGSDAILLAVAALIDAAGGTTFAPYLQVARAGPASAPDPRAMRDIPEVVTVPFTFFASAGSVVHAGAAPRFVDIEPDAYGMDPRGVAAAITPRTVAVLPVHLFGQPCDLDEVMAASGAVPVIEDAAQAIGAAYHGIGRERIVGGIGRLGALSFFPTKNLGGAGDGGMVTTNDDRLAEHLRKIRVHGGRQMYHHETVGWNSRLDELQAAVLGVKLDRLASWSEARRARAGTYDALIETSGLRSRGLVTPPPRRSGRGHIFHQYVVRVAADRPEKNRDALRSYLADAGIATGIYYPVPLHLQACFRGLGYAKGDFPVSERAAEEVLALPIYPELGSEAQSYVVAKMAEFFALT